MKQHFNMYAAYNRWANDRVYAEAALLTQEARDRDMGAFFRTITGTLNHILVADRIWLKRFTGGGDAPTRLDAILFTEFDQLTAAREKEDQRLQDWVESLDDDALAGRITYMTATDMRTISQRLAPALLHVFNHQTHHRGQVHAMLTALGRPSVQLDLLAFQRMPEGLAYA